jgi:hypothetical protein
MSDSEISNLEWQVAEAACRLMDVGGVGDYDWSGEGAKAYKELETATHTLITAREQKEKSAG